MTTCDNIRNFYDVTSLPSNFRDNNDSSGFDLFIMDWRRCTCNLNEFYDFSRFDDLEYSVADA